MVTSGGQASDVDVVAVRLARQVGEKAVSWLGTMRTCFRLERDRPGQDLDNGALKSLAELALAGEIIRREAVAGPHCARTAEGLLEFAWRELDEGEVLYRLQAGTPAATHPMEMYASFAATGHRHDGLDRLTTHLHGLRASRVSEHVPNRRLAVAAVAAKIGFPLRDDLAALTGRTWLGGMPEPWMLDLANAYGLTHTVFHLTDYGDRPEGLPGPLQGYLHQWLPVWVEVYREIRFWDLLLELLIVGTCLKRPLFFPAVWPEVAAAQQADGLMPNGVTTPPADPQAAWVNHRHPTIVAAIAGTLTLSRALTRATPGESTS
ncbi:hypothetical protein AB0I81_35990 [Nonomuraea sp. NPDC050404]|uniref:DUF6895 family protein n=1 Tax=Nonomuraea sp. NPDC050404 TaxID=3155783 RepID=UPI0033C15E5D